MGGKYEKKYKAQASKIEQLEQMHTDLLARLEKGVTMQPAPPSFDCPHVRCIMSIHRAAASVSQGLLGICEAYTFPNNKSQ